MNTVGLHMNSSIDICVCTFQMESPVVEFTAMLKEQEHSEAALAAEHMAARITPRGSVSIRQHLQV